MNYVDEVTGEQVFTFRFPGPGPVWIVGEFNAWCAGRQAMSRMDGFWKIALRLPPGRYRYGFSVRGCLFRDGEVERESVSHGWPWSFAEIHPNAVSAVGPMS